MERVIRTKNAADHDHASRTAALVCTAVWLDICSAGSSVQVIVIIVGFVVACARCCSANDAVQLQMSKDRRPDRI